MFKPVSSKVDFPAMEREVMQWWGDNDTVKKYLKRNEKSGKRFSFIDGPVTANNPLGVHHAWGRTYKDMFQRFKTMQGYRQRYQNGFDGQGLWIEVEVEKELGLNSKRDIETFGIDKFVDLCKERVRRFSDIQTSQSIRLGYWMDWENSYHTMSDENNYTIWHFLKVCHERGWIYEGTDVMPWCPRCGTGLSQHEIVTEGYKEIVHPGLYVRLPLLGRRDEALLIWTTTPWTLSSNTSAYVHPELTYVKVRTEATSSRGGDEILYLLKSRLSTLRAAHEVLEEMPGRALEGLRYQGPFDELPVQEGVDHRVVAWEEVSESEGTGIVHAAPGAGQVDFAISKKEDLAVIAPLDEFGVFVEGFDWLTGKSVFEVNEPVYDSLKAKGLFYRLEKYAHRYPVCWRCDTELVFRLVDEWFISMGQPRDLIADATKKVKWVPEFGLDRELDWLRNMDDWMISKKRYWGLALPIYKCHECGHFEVMGSEDELRDRAEEGWAKFEGHSPHRPWIDAVKIQCAKCGSRVSRIPDVGNPWLDAGIVTFSTLGYRSNKEQWRKWFPADLVSESFPGQFRNWFYSLLTMSAILEDSEPSRAIHTYALLLDEKGDEMHKSKGNAIWLDDAAEEMGVDAMRWVYSRHTAANNIRFGYSAADEVRRRVLIPLWNVYSFFVTYANIDHYDPADLAPPLEERDELDRWIISELHSLISEVTQSLEEYEPEIGARAAESFVEFLSNWYVRRSRRRFWKAGVLIGTGPGADADKRAAYATLYECLVTLTRLLAPFIPFMTEAMHRNLSAPSDKGGKSVHHEDYPESDPSKVDRNLVDATRLAMRLSSLGRAARSRAGIKVRQPLEKVLVKLRSVDETSIVETVADQIRDELNVKEVVVLENESDVLLFEIRPNMGLIGPKYGVAVPELMVAIAEADAYDVSAKVAEGRQVEVGKFTLEPDEIIVAALAREGHSVSSDAGYLVAVTTVITPALATEGFAREIVHVVQNMRRSAGFDIADHITTYYDCEDDPQNLMTPQCEYICRETLSRELVRGAPPKGAFSEIHTVNGFEVALGIKKE